MTNLKYLVLGHQWRSWCTGLLALPNVALDRCLRCKQLRPHWRTV